MMVEGTPPKLLNPGLCHAGFGQRCWARGAPSMVCNRRPEQGIVHQRPGSSWDLPARQSQGWAPLPAALLWVTELKRWPGWGRRAATKPGCWVKRDRTATRDGEKAGGRNQGRAKIVEMEVFNLARVSK